MELVKSITVMNGANVIWQYEIKGSEVMTYSFGCGGSTLFVVMVFDNGEDAKLYNNGFSCLKYLKKEFWGMQAVIEYYQ